MRRRFSCGDNPDDFVLALFAVRVGYENDDDRADQTHGLPSLLAVDDAIRAADVERILEDEPGGLEAVILCLARLRRSFSSSQTNRMIVVAF
jgi:hypothetical protein